MNGTRADLAESIATPHAVRQSRLIDIAETKLRHLVRQIIMRELDKPAVTATRRLLT